MSDLESRLRRALADDEEPADDGFTSKVAQRIDSYELGRTVRLCVITLIAFYLTGTFVYGLYLSWIAAQAVPTDPSTVWWTSVSSLALVGIASLVLRPRPHSRE